MNETAISNKGASLPDKRDFNGDICDDTFSDLRLILSDEHEKPCPLCKLDLNDNYNDWNCDGCGYPIPDDEYFTGRELA